MNGYSFNVSFSNCPSQTPYPNFTAVNVNLAAMGNSATISVVTSQDAGSLLLGGSFSLSFSGFVWTAQIPTNATNAQIGAALLALPEVANVKVTREPAIPALTGLTLYVAVLLPVVNLPKLMVNGSQLKGTGLSTYVVNPCQLWRVHFWYRY